MKHNYKFYLRWLWVKLMHLGYLSGCHQLPERSFFYKQYQFPVCARCCGVLLGQMFSLVLLGFKIIFSVPLAIILMLIMFFDWFIQFVEIKESNNTRRFLTGFLGGLGCWMFYFNIIKTIYRKIKTK